jgi:hypothetical protein
VKDTAWRGENEETRTARSVGILNRVEPPPILHNPRRRRVDPNHQIPPLPHRGRKIARRRAAPLPVLDRELLPTDSQRVARIPILIVRDTDLLSGLEGRWDDPLCLLVEGDTDGARRAVDGRREARGGEGAAGRGVEGFVLWDRVIVSVLFTLHGVKAKGAEVV